MNKIFGVTVPLLFVAVAFSLVTAPEAPAQGQAPVYPHLIPLPEGFGPEGIAVGNGSTFYVGAAIGSDPSVLGQILVGNLRTGNFSQLVGPTGMHALGIKFDSRSNLLFVAGGPTGTGRVYNATSGDQVAFYQFRPPVTGPAFTTLVNDVVVTRDGAYFTDSAGAPAIGFPPSVPQSPSLYRVALGPWGEPSASFDEIPLPSVFGFGPGAFGACGPAARANGIAADPSGKYLIIGNSSHGKLYRMDTATHTVVPIELIGGPVCGADGLVLDGKTLYVVSKNQVTDPVDNQVAVVELSPDFSSGEITRHITEPFASNAATKAPATIAEFGNSLYAVTGGFAPPAPDYVVRLLK